MQSKPTIAFYDPAATELEWRRNLPHLIQADCVYFVTMHLADSIPLRVQQRWAADIERWQQANPPPHSPAQQEQYADLQYRRRERWLDRGTGSGVLSRALCQDKVEACLTRFDGERLWLGDYSIMPNHLHALILLPPGTGLRQITDSWRMTTTREINKAIGRTGTLWYRDPFDHIVRSPESLKSIRRYIQRNGEHLPAGRYRSGCGSLFTEA